MRYCPAQSRHDSGVGACLVESGLYISILVHLLDLVFIFSPSLAFISLLLLFLHALAFIFSVTRCLASLDWWIHLFFSFLGTCRRVQHGQYSAVVLRRSA